METSYLKTLELDKIIARAAEGCVCKESREKLLAIELSATPMKCGMRWNRPMHQFTAHQERLAPLRWSRGRQSAGRPRCQGRCPLNG